MGCNEEDWGMQEESVRRVVHDDCKTKFEQSNSTCSIIIHTRMADFNSYVSY
jgi:hypothetical protein